jgi:S-adenosylmethionine decarboxylase proenzyme
MRKVGFQIYAELHGCDRQKISKVKTVRKFLLDAIRVSKLKAVKHHFHQFKPYGVTAVAILRESHIAFHTWPELEYASLDIFVCEKRGIKKAKIALKLIKDAVNAKKVKIRKFPRGI